jgi:hypothetical protein
MSDKLEFRGLFIIYHVYYALTDWFRFEKSLYFSHLRIHLIIPL